MEEIKIYLEQKFRNGQEYHEGIIKRILETSKAHSYYVIAHYPHNTTENYDYIIYPMLKDGESLTKVIEELNKVSGITAKVGTVKYESEKPPFLRKTM